MAWVYRVRIRSAEFILLVIIPSTHSSGFPFQQTIPGYQNWLLPKGLVIPNQCIAVCVYKILLDIWFALEIEIMQDN